MIIILISGKVESGKDTFYEIAKEYLKYNRCSRYAFGDNIKRIALKLTWDGKKDQKGRKLLQWLGRIARTYNPSVWVELLCKDLIYDYENSIILPNSIVFVTDCRYLNEIESLKKVSRERNWECYSIRINRPNYVSRLTQKQLRDITELALDNYQVWDFTIENTGGLDYYRTQCEFILSKILYYGEGG